MKNSAKETFCHSPHRAAHERTVQTESFQTACDYALLQLLSEMPSAPDPQRGWDSHSQMCGARRIIQILKTLHEPVKNPVAPKIDRLNPEAGV